MPLHESADQSSGMEWASNRLADYQPAYPLGNLRDAILIAKSSGRPIEDFLDPQLIEKTPDYPPEAWEISDDTKEG
jgi:hypothetical protein